MAISYPQTGHQRLQVIERLTERLGNLVNDLTFKLPQNGIVGVIGPNGAGKSTLFKMCQNVRVSLAKDTKRKGLFYNKLERFSINAKNYAF